MTSLRDRLTNISMADIQRALSDAWQKQMEASSKLLTAKSGDEYAEAQAALTKAMNETASLALDVAAEKEEETHDQEEAEEEAIITLAMPESEDISFDVTLEVFATLERHHIGHCLLRASVDAAYLQPGEAVAISLAALAAHEAKQADEFVTIATDITGDVPPAEPATFMVNADAIDFGTNIDLTQSTATLSDRSVAPDYVLNFTGNINYDDITIIMGNVEDNSITCMQVINHETGVTILTQTIALDHRILDLRHEADREYLYQLTRVAALEDTTGLVSEPESHTARLTRDHQPQVARPLPASTH